MMVPMLAGSTEAAETELRPAMPAAETALAAAVSMEAFSAPAAEALEATSAASLKAAAETAPASLEATTTATAMAHLCDVRSLCLQVNLRHRRGGGGLRHDGAYENAACQSGHNC
jgi:hypothetical protein